MTAASQSEAMLENPRLLTWIESCMIPMNPCVHIYIALWDWFVILSHAILLIEYLHEKLLVKGFVMMRKGWPQHCFSSQVMIDILPINSVFIFSFWLMSLEIYCKRKCKVYNEILMLRLSTVLWHCIKSGCSYQDCQSGEMGNWNV